MVPQRAFHPMFTNIFDGHRSTHRSDRVVHMSFASARATGHGIILAIAFLLAMSGNAASKDPKARDPGVRDGSAGAGGALPGISGAYNNLFAAGVAKLIEFDQVRDGL